MLQNTKNIILENWPGPKEGELKETKNYHFAIFQDGISLEFYFEKFFYDKKVTFHKFNNFDALISICQRNQIDAIVIGSENNIEINLELIHSIKQNIFLSIIPVILYHPNPEQNQIIAAYENGVEEFIYGEWIDRLVQVRIEKAIERNRRDLSINGSTQLPGTNIIENEIIRQLEMQAEFAICYADLDNFKAYNDYYGYYYGDKIIRLTSKIIRDTVFDLCREGFVGHIAGDDFICINPVDLVDDICGQIIKTFDTLIPYRYELEDRERGYITSVNRKGQLEEFPLLTISIAVVINSNGKFDHVGELSHMLADLKKAVKMKDGSNYMIERRQKY